MHRKLATALALVVALVACSEGFAQTGSVYTDTQLQTLRNANSTARFSSNFYQSRAVRGAVPQFAFSTVNRDLFRSTLGGGQPAAVRPKPFASASRGPTVSPYLDLTSPFTSSATNYYTQVRPRLDQQRAEEQAIRQNIAKQQQLNSYAAKGPYDPQGSENMAPTGHAAVYMNYGGYYPQAR